MTVLPHFYVDPKSGFGVENLPFGIFSRLGFHHKQVGVAIGEFVLDLAALEHQGIISLGDETLFDRNDLNNFAALGAAARIDLRQQLQTLLSDPSSALSNESFRDEVLVKRCLVEMHYPFKTGDYTDFYSSENHARNVGSLFRDPENALNPNWKQLPVAYHGRTSSLVASDLKLKRPHGQILEKGSSTPIFSPSLKLDYEVEMGIFIGAANQMFEPIPIEKARDSVFGFVIVNDWSARDIQAYEYAPLGPFLGKNFLTSVSPWVVTPEALEPFIMEMPEQDISPLEYLRLLKRTTFNIQLEASIQTALGHTEVISTTNFKHQYWSLDQQIAHHTVNGCKMQTGDLLATGTLSGPTQESAGCLLEITKNGANPVHLTNGETRTFLEDGDTLTIEAHCKNGNTILWFGNVSGTIVG